ncbi:MAG: hypothetical protein DBP01_04610, partial [gamma proteobacterium symbiont of Ctena orbiculata]
MKRNLRIFIGSSSFYAPKNDQENIDRTLTTEDLLNIGSDTPLLPVFSALKIAGFEPCPWWSTDVWKDGESFYSSVMRASLEHDGSIFIFGPDDLLVKPTNDNTNSSHIASVTRNDVVFEFGLFLGVKGKQRTLVIFDRPQEQDESTYKVMSDLAGITYPALNDPDLTERIITFFSQPEGEHRFDEVKMYANPALWRSKRSREFEYWKTKCLYIGTQSAVLWDRIEGHRSYKRYIGFLHAFIDDLAKPDSEYKQIYRQIDNIVSFGPGSGKTDLALVARIKAHNDTISYIPIDINPVLASMAATEVSSDKLIRIPFIIVDDFEANHSLIRDVIDKNSHKIGHRNLFVMLGVTFSNIEDTESRFFLKIKDWMGKDDYFLLDVNIYKDDGRTDQDFAQELEEELLNEKSDTPDYSSLLAYTIANKHPKLDYQTMSPAGESDGPCIKIRPIRGNKVLLRDIFKIIPISGEEAKQ